MGPAGASKEGDRKSTLTLTDAIAALEEMKRTGCISAQGPYILDIPQDTSSEYHHRNDFQKFQYTYNTPFTRDEWENTQYQTFVYYEPSNEELKMYTQHAHQQSQVQAAAPVSDAPKKKISLSAWKNRQAVSTPGTPTSGGEHGKSLNPVQRIKQEEVSDVVVQEHDKADQAESTSKRKRVDSTQDSNADREDGEIDGSPASKRSRFSDPAVDTQTTDDTTMPNKLSPLRSRHSEDEIPPKLSSSLPQIIVDAVQERKRSSLAAASVARPASARKDGKLTPTVNGTSKEATSTPAPKNGLRAGSPHLKDGTEVKQASKVSKQDASPSTNGVKHKKSDGAVDVIKNATSDASKKKTRPVTPTTSALSPESAKGQSGTPSLRKGMAMTRVHSMEGTTPAEADTPRSTGMDKTPSKVSNKSAAQQAWDAKKLHLDAVARRLKHESQDYKNSKPPNIQLAAIKAVECLAAYMISFSCIDHSAALAEPRGTRPFKIWKELKALFGYLRFVCTSIAPLGGIAAMLTFSYASHMLDVIESTPKAHDKEIIVEYLQLQRKASKEMDELLSTQTLIDDFPQCWKQAQHGKAEESIPAIDELLSAEYHLPVSLHTTPLQAARAARALLAEWLERSETKHKLQDLSSK